MVYVISDIHGNEKRFQSIMQQIGLKPEDTVYILGDVVDRYPGGIRILQKIMAMPNARMILGNHEYMMLRALGCPYDDYEDDGNALEHWYRNGGRVTHNHLKRIRKVKRREIVDYLRQLPLSLDVEVNGKGYKLVHGAVPEDYVPGPPYRNPIHYAVWKRLDAADPTPEDRILIFGHTPTRYYRDQIPMEVWQEGNLMGIDCGCGYPEDNPAGRLACVRLDDGKVFYSC